MSPDERRPYGGGNFDRGRPDRGRPVHDRGGDRPPSDRGFGGARPFARPPLRGGDLPPPDHSVRLRDGDRAVEVSGSPAFVRQVLDDIPALMARLRGEAAPRGGGISMPAPPAEPASTEAAPAAPAAAAPSRPVSLEERILAVLRDSPGPLAIAAIRQRLGDASVSGQQVRRLLERANGRVVASGERPATYTLR